MRGICIFLFVATLLFVALTTLAIETTSTEQRGPMLEDMLERQDRIDGILQMRSVRTVGLVIGGLALFGMIFIPRKRKAGSGYSNSSDDDKASSHEGLD